MIKKYKKSMASRKRRTLTVVSDTPESSKGNLTIVEDSVFDTSQVCMIKIIMILNVKISSI